MTAVRTIWKKLAAAVFWLISGGLVVLIAATKFATPQGHGTHTPRAIERASKKAARPRPADEDAKTVLWLARLHDRPARVMAAPFAAIGAWLAAFAAVLPRQPPSPVGASGPHSNQTGGSVGTGNPIPPPGVPAADVDQYLTEHAEQYRHGFDEAFPVLAGELAPLPWLQPTLPPLPEPDIEYLPHACPDVDQPTATLRPQIPASFTEDELAELRERFYASLGKPPVVLTPDEMCPEGCGCRLDGEDADRRECGCDGPCTGGDEEWGEEYDVPAFPPAQDVPGPASAPAPPAGSAQAAPPAAAGPGTPDDTLTDMAAVADRSFVNDVAARPLDWAAWLDLCLHGDLDTVRAVGHA